MAKKIHKYAALASKDGFYLDVVDAQLFAIVAGQKVAFVRDGPHEVLECTTVKNLWGGVWPQGGTLGVAEELDQKSWCLISCNASFDPQGQMNHWCPGFFKEAVPDHFFDLTQMEQSKAMQQVVAHRKALRHLEAQRPDDPDPALLESKIFGIEEEKTRFLVLPRWDMGRFVEVSRRYIYIYLYLYL